MARVGEGLTGASMHQRIDLHSRAGGIVMSVSAGEYGRNEGKRFPRLLLTRPETGPLKEETP